MKHQKLNRFSKNDPGRDRLSEMPDEVLVHILSCLPTVDAVRTVLLRCFGNLWTLVHTLEFDHSNWESDNVKRFYSFIRNAVMLHKRPVIDKFLIYLEDLGHLPKEVRHEYGNYIHMGLRFALDKQAKEIRFSDICVDGTGSSDFPNFSSASLVTLELFYCNIDLRVQVNLGSLKKLILNCVNMCENAFQQFLSGCPSLEELSIVEPECARKLRFSAPSIRKLFVVLREWDFSREPWSFDFPKLHSLELDIDRIPDVVDLSFLRNINLTNFRCQLMDNDEDEQRMFNIFLEKIAGTEVVQLSRSISERFLHPIDDLRLLQIRWKHVVLGLKVFCRSCLLGFYQLMSCSKQLEELIIYTTSKRSYECRLNKACDLPPAELSYPCVMPKLKTVTLHCFAERWKHQLQLVEFLLKSATVLEKLVIILNTAGLTETKKLDFVMHVLSFPRSSPDARVLFH